MLMKQIWWAIYRKYEVLMNIYKQGDVIIYGAEGLCKVVDITEKQFGKEKVQYYVLEQMGKTGSVTYVPANNERSLNKMRPVLTKEEIYTLFNDDAQKLDWIEKDRDRQKIFKEIILFGNTKDLINLIKTLHLKQQEQKIIGKKLHISDERIFKDAEKIIDEEIAYIFEIPKESVHDFIVENIKK